MATMITVSIKKKTRSAVFENRSNSHFFAVFNVTTCINSKNTNLKYNFLNYPNFQSPQKSIYMCMQWKDNANSLYTWHIRKIVKLPSVPSNISLSASIITQNSAWYIDFKLLRLEGQLVLLVSFKNHTKQSLSY